MPSNPLPGAQPPSRTPDQRAAIGATFYFGVLVTLFFLLAATFAALFNSSRVFAFVLFGGATVALIMSSLQFKEERIKERLKEETLLRTAFLQDGFGLELVNTLRVAAHHAASLAIDTKDPIQNARLQEHVVRVHRLKARLEAILKP
jgi:hypothetical protein